MVAGFPRSGTSWLAKGLSFAGLHLLSRAGQLRPGRPGGGAFRLALPDPGSGRPGLPRSHDARLCRPGCHRVHHERGSGPPAAPVRGPGALAGRADPRPLPSEAGGPPQARLRQPQSRMARGALSPRAAALRAAPSLRAVRELAPAGLGAAAGPHAGEPAPHGRPSAAVRGPAPPGERLLGAGRRPVGRDGVRDAPPDHRRVAPRDRGLRMALRGPGGPVRGALSPARPGMERICRAFPHPVTPLYSRTRPKKAITGAVGGSPSAARASARVIVSG